MATVEIHIRRPPCDYCHQDGQIHPHLGSALERSMACPRCHGASGIVEYSMFVAGRGLWMRWPTPRQRILERLVADSRIRAL